MISAPQPLDLPDGEATLYPAFFVSTDANRLLQALVDTSAWRQDEITLYGRSVNLPRLTAWYGDAGPGYTYSRIENTPLPWTEALLEVKRRK